MEINRQKLVGRDKGSLTEQQTKGTGTTTIQKKGNIQNKPAEQNRSLGLNHCCAFPSRERVPAVPPPPPEPSMTAHGMEYPALFGQVGVSPPGCAPSWSPVKINPVLAEPRTRSSTLKYSYGSSLFSTPNQSFQPVEDFDHHRKSY